jgi:hypothetical protein
VDAYFFVASRLHNDRSNRLFNKNLLVNAIFILILIVFYTIRSNMLPENIAGYAQYQVLVVRQSDAIWEQRLA